MAQSILKKIFSSKPLSYLLILLLFFALVSLGRGVNRRISFKRELTRTEGQVSVLELENQKLLKELGQTQTDYFKEKVARLKLGLRKPGERMIVVVPPDNLTEQEPKLKYFKQKISNFKTWWNYFFPNSQNFRTK